MVTQKKEGAVERTVDFLFKEENNRYILLLFVIGLVLRLFISLRIPFGADEMGYAVHSIGFIDSGKLQIHDQDGVWFFLSDLFMNLLGVNVLGLRFLAVLFGSLSIILIYLVGKEVFDKQVALIAAFLLTVSSYSILISIGSMDVPMAFFSLFSMYFLILFFKTNSSKYFVFTWISLGIAIMIKQIALLFIPAFILFSLFYNKKNNNSWKISQLIYAALIIVLMVTPVLAYNHLLYKDKGLVDMQFSRFFGIAEEKYQDISATLKPFSLKTLLISHDGDIPGFLIALKFIYSFESLFISLFAVLGIFIVVSSKRQFKWLLFLSLLFPFIFLAGTSLLSNHFVFTAFFLSLFSAKGIDFLSDKFKEPGNKKRIIFIILILVIFSSAFQVYKYNNNGFFGKNEIAQMIDFKDEEIPDTSLVIVDSRIYRGRIAFMFWDRHYLETNYFQNLVQLQNEFPDNLEPYQTYFVEAVTDDSGWGSIKYQPEFNQTTEQIVDFFKQGGKLIKTINDSQGNPHFAVYWGYLDLPKGIQELADTTHSFFFYPLEYKPKEEVFDNYQLYTLPDTLLDKLAHIILYTEVILALLSIPFIFYLLFKKT